MAVLVASAPDGFTSRSAQLYAVADAWVASQPILGITVPNLAKSLDHLVTHFLASGPANRGHALPGGALDLYSRTGVNPLDAAVCRSFAKRADIAESFGVVFRTLATELAPLAAAVQLARTPCQERAIELSREAGLYREAGSQEAPITLEKVKDRIVSVLTPLAVDEYVAAPGLTWDAYLNVLLRGHVADVGAIVFRKLVAATDGRFPTTEEHDVLVDFERLWGAVASERLVRLAAKICGDAAEDAVQDAAVRVLRWVRKNPGFEHPSPAAWLQRVVSHTAKDQAVKRSRLPVPTEVTPTVLAADLFRSWEGFESVRSLVLVVAEALEVSEDEDDRLAALALTRCIRGLERGGEELWLDLNEVRFKRALATSILAEAGSNARAGRVALRALAATGQ